MRAFPFRSVGPDPATMTAMGGPFTSTGSASVPANSMVPLVKLNGRSSTPVGGTVSACARAACHGIIPIEQRSAAKDVVVRLM